MGESLRLSPNIPSPGLSEDLLLLAGLGQLFNTRLQTAEIVVLLTRLVAERLGAICVFFRAEPDAGVLRATAWHAAAPETLEKLEAVFTDFTGPYGEFMVGSAAARGEAIFAPDLAAINEPMHPIWPQLAAAGLIAVPLSQSSELLGMLVAVRGPDDSLFSQHDFDLVRTLAPQAAGAIINARILAEERWQRQKAELMFQASKAVHMELHFDQAVREIALLLKQAIKVSWVGLLEYQPAEQALFLLGSTAEPAVDLRLGAQRMRLAEWHEAESALADAASALKRPLRLPSVLASGTGLGEPYAWALPLLHKQVPQGLLLLSAPGPEGVFPNEALEVAVGIAELVALAMTNQHLIDQEAKARIQIIRSQAAAQEREVLLRQIVHDLRNATQAMSLVVEDMEFESGNHPQLNASLSTLNSQITFISNFLKEKLNWIQQGERLGGEHATAASEVFADLESRFGPSARAKHQRLVVSAPEPIKLPLSAIQLEQIIGNLLDNAIKYTPAHGEIRLWAEHSDGWLTIYVADNGPGIPMSDQARLGEVGYRGSQRQEGNGLGLANVRQLVTRAGGLFGVSSIEGAGTTFHVSLPTTAWGRVIS